MTVVNVSLDTNELNIIQHLIISGGNAQLPEQTRLLNKVERALDQLASVPVTVETDVNRFAAPDAPQMPKPTGVNPQSPIEPTVVTPRAPAPGPVWRALAARVDVLFKHFEKLSGAMDQAMDLMKELPKMETRVNSALHNSEQALRVMEAVKQIPDKFSQLRADTTRAIADAKTQTVDKIQDLSRGVGNHTVRLDKHDHDFAAVTRVVEGYRQSVTTFSRTYDDRLHALQQKVRELELVTPGKPASGEPVIALPENPAQLGLFTRAAMSALSKFGMVRAEHLPERLHRDLRKMVAVHTDWIQNKGPQEAFVQAAAEVLTTFKAML